MMRISVVIPTFNRARLLEQTLPALERQRVDDDLQYEVLFVSNGSSDDTDVVLNAAVQRAPDIVRYFFIQPTGGPSAPRNRGIREARGDVVIILDDDVLPDEDLVQQHANFHRAHPERHHAAVGEVYVPDRLLSDPLSLFHTFPYHEVRGLERLSYLHFWTCNVSFKREFMLEEGMFDESFLFYEDVLCGFKLSRAGMHLHFLPQARGQHLHQITASGIPTKARFTGMWLYAFLQKLPEREVKERYDTIISRDLPFGMLCKRVAKRIIFHVVANPASMAFMRLLGATRRKRDRFTDRYYGWVFRRNMLAGYNAAKRQAAAGRPPLNGSSSDPWVDRGESLRSAHSSSVR